MREGGGGDGQRAVVTVAMVRYCCRCRREAVAVDPGGADVALGYGTGGA